MSTSAEARSISISLLALPESTPAALYGLYEVFSSVGSVWSELTGESITGPKLVPRIVSPDGQAFQCAIGLPIAPQASLEETAHTDIVVVTDLTLTAINDPRGRWPAAARWLREQFDGGATICSVCTGSVLLADSGLLNGYEATTHWSASDLFRRHFPGVRLRPERILLPSGPEHRIVTSGGASSWEDLALYLIARYCGEAEAVRTAKIFLFGDRSEGQAAYAVAGQGRRHEDAVIAQCQTWIAEHYAGDNPVSRMVAQAGLPERTFKRRFRAATGYAPVEYVQTLRIEEAKQLLETTGEPTDTIAHMVGYDDPAFFRRLFKRRTGITPARYRQRFQSIARLHQTA
jgi:transcriptional regulator GlxA family with amidase domain